MVVRMVRSIWRSSYFLLWLTLSDAPPGVFGAASIPGDAILPA